MAFSIDQSTTSSFTIPLNINSRVYNITLHQITDNNNAQDIKIHPRRNANLTDKITCYMFNQTVIGNLAFNIAVIGAE